jgi:CRISPR-associated endonuclease/helicase Cas3
VAKWIARYGFQPDGPAEPASGPAFLIATSAGEVGIDVDADHLVADLVAWERMVQRLGRVNRRGDGAARIDILAAAPAKPDAPTEREARAAATARLLARLPALPEGGHDASPAALITLKADAACQPLLGKATRALVDAWSLTSLDTHPGRPQVGPWLRGWDEEEPHTTLIWRRFLPWRREEIARKPEIDAYFEHAPPARAEQLEAPVWRALAVLGERAKALLTTRPARAGEPAVLVLGASLGLDEALTLAELRDFRKDSAMGRLADRTLVVAAALGGLSEDGLLDQAATGEEALLTLDGPAGMAADQVLILRQNPGERPEQVPESWILAHAWPSRRGEDGEPAEEIGIWKRDAKSVEDALTRTVAQSLAAHTEAVTRCAEALAARIGLAPPHRAMLAAAARLHDAGKASDTWQDAFGAPRDGRPYAKTATRWINQALLDGYRHEFGSLPAAEADPALCALPLELRDLALHLIAAHHGGARPLIRHGGDVARAAEVALRFARLQRRWGPWGLAWWEALLRAADAEASRQHDEEPD